jgi:hypothetical protein
MLFYVGGKENCNEIFYYARPSLSASPKFGLLLKNQKKNNHGKKIIFPPPKKIGKKK